MKNLTHMAQVARYLVVVVVLLNSALSHAGVEQQRKLFKQAEQALKNNNQDMFDEIVVSLNDYPVVAYLRYDQFKKQLRLKSRQQVRDFLDQHKDYPFQYHLLSKWLNLLAKRGQWQDYLDFYDDRTETRFKCLELTARLETGKSRQINREIRKLWLTGYSQPDACDKPFAHFLETEPGVSRDIWQRIEKAFKARRSSLAEYLARKLDKKDRAIVYDWKNAHRKPEQWLEKPGKRDDTAINRKIIVHALDRLARKDSIKARNIWSRLNGVYHFSNDQVVELEKRFALSAALQHKTQAKEWLQDLPSESKNNTAHLWLARIHLRDEDWIGLIKTIKSMPKHLQKEAEWRYWLARAYQEAGSGDKAEQQFASLANRSSYYGFLAADQVGRRYSIRQQHVTQNLSFDEDDFLQDKVNLLRARELYFLDRLVEARREWFQGIRRLKSDEIKQAAKIASDWKWHENAIKTVAKTDHRRDYDLRFPMPYEDLVMDNITKHGLDPSVIYGVMRRESLFDPLAKSRVGALGLMQLMPATAKSVAKTIGLEKTGQYAILNIRNNIRLGTQYFKSVLDRFDNNVSLAAAAYNAGPRNVKRWLPEEQTMKADLWIETVPYKETRNYVQAVLAYATIFDRRRNNDVQISSRMDDVKTAY